MEVLDKVVTGNAVNPHQSEIYLQRQCPGCFAAAPARLEVQSAPAAETLPFLQQGPFLSGYTNQRVFFSYHRCPSCQLLYCPTYFTQEQLNQLYKNQSENMADVPLEARVRTQYAYYQLLKKYASFAGDYLEIGADIGLFAKFFADNAVTKRLFLYEPNEKVHASLKENTRSNNHVKLITSNYVPSDIEANSLATAVIIHALDHVLAPRQLLQGLYQNLAPGGVLFIVTHDESSLLARVLKKKWPPYTLQHPHLFRASTLKTLLNAEGFNVLARKKTANYFPLTHFIDGGMTALGLKRFPVPRVDRLILPIKLGNIATIAQKPVWAGL